MNDTVKIHISIQISTEGEHDTGLTVEEWNAMTDAQRSAIAKEAWDAEAGNGDDGGMGVITDGAEDI